MSAFLTCMRLVRIGWLFFLLVTLLVLQRSCQPVAAPPVVFAPSASPLLAGGPVDTNRQRPAGSLQRKALPQSRWRLVPGPAYLVYPLPHRPKQSTLDAAAEAARLHKI